MSESTVALVAIIFLVLTAVAVFSIAIIYVVTALFAMRTFRKMGIAGWKAWVPVLNTWVWLEQGKLPGAISLLLLLPAIGVNNQDIFSLYSNFADLAGLAVLAATMIATSRIAPKFGKVKEYYFLVLIPPVLFGLPASKKAVYQG